MSNVVFLLGAGVSIPAGMPSTWDITQCVMSGQREACTRKERVVRTGLYSYRFTTCPTVYELRDDHVTYIVQLICMLRAFLERIYGDGQDNYESIFYALRLIIDGQEGTRSDPGTLFFWREIIAKIKDELCITDDKLLILMGEAEAYIYNVVWRMLERKPFMFDHLSCVIGSLSKTIASPGSLKVPGVVCHTTMPGKMIIWARDPIDIAPAFEISHTFSIRECIHCS